MDEITLQSSPAPLPTPSAGWTQREVVLCLLIVYLLPGLCYSALSETGFYRWFYGNALTALANNEAAPLDDDARADLGLWVGPIAAKYDAVRLQLRHQARTHLVLWAQALSGMLCALAIPSLLRLTNPEGWQRLGVTGRQFGLNVARGLVAWFLLTPIVFGVNLAVMLFLKLAQAGEIDEHPLTQLAHHGLLPGEWIIVTFIATVSAPWFEETLFRGLLQTWFASYESGGRVALWFAFIYALSSRYSQLAPAWHEGPGPLASAMLPALFILVLIVLHQITIVPRGNRTASAIYGTAALFASVHTFAWPTPVPLFFLAIGLGNQASRTGSLVGPIVVHSLFNGLSCLVLLLGAT